MTTAPAGARPIDFTGLDFSTVPVAAASCTGIGVHVLPIPHRSKNPGRRGWQKLRLEEADLPQHFNGDPQNIGVLLGEPSLNLLDVDGDCAEAVAIMPVYLPETGAVFGRPGKPASHWLYQAIGPVPKTMKLTDVDGKTCLIELRSTGVQTVFPPSAHEGTGEIIRFEKQGIATPVDPLTLRRMVERVAAGALLARRWGTGSRHDIALALAGMLLQAKWATEKAEECIGAVARAGGDEEVEDRLTAVATTAANIEAGKPVTGFRSLIDLIGAEAAERVRKWLYLGKGDTAKPRDRTGQYQATPNGIIWLREDRDGTTEVPLTNFTATVAGDIVEDDGAERTRFLDVCCGLNGKEHSVRLPTSAFNSMNWPVEKLGPTAIVMPGMGTRDRARAAIQLLSPKEMPTTVVYTHTGWRKIDGIGWVYLHAAGAIGPDGPVQGTETRLEGALALFELPAPPEGEGLVTAIHASLRVPELAPPRVGVPAYGSLWRAILGECDLGVFKVGPTGAFKSEFSALHQQHFGAGMDRLHLPGSWVSTENALEDLLFRAKDTLFVIDDFKPAGHAGEDARLHARADRIFRGTGNASGRHRMRSDTTLRAVRPPRALPMSSGEDLPRGQSLRARVMTLEIGHGDIDPKRLLACQKDAGRGLYSEATAAFVRWMAGKYEQVRARHRERTLELRGELKGPHRRTPANIASLLAALEIFLQFVHETTGGDALTKAEAGELLAGWRAALIETARAQWDAQDDADPALRYADLLSSAISSGRAHLVDSDGKVPPSPDMWGWRHDRVGRDVEWRPHGDQIGWVDDGYVYLDPQAAYRAAQAMCGPGESLPVSEHRLRKLMKEKGMLALMEESRGKLLYRVVLQGSRRAVIAIRPDLLREAAQPTQAAQEVPS